MQPGLTGWAQINYPYGNTIHDALQKLQYDLFYIKNRSLLFDLSILFPLEPYPGPVSLPWLDPLFRLSPGHPDSPPENSCLIFYQIEGLQKITVTPGQADPRDVQLSD